MSRQHKISRLNKFLCYVLERRPDEFGLIPDNGGWIPIKKLVQALSEIDGWHNVGKNDILELMFYPECCIEIENNRIRAKNRQNLPAFEPCTDVPAILYFFVRRRAYALALEKGVSSGPGGRIVCSPDRKLVERIAKRFDPKPVILTLHTRSARAVEIKFSRFGNFLFICDRIPAEAFTGPALSTIIKSPPEKEKTKARKDKIQKHPGSFTLTSEMAGFMPAGKIKKGRKKKISWKEERKKGKRHKK